MLGIVIGVCLALLVIITSIQPREVRSDYRAVSEENNE